VLKYFLVLLFVLASAAITFGQSTPIPSRTPPVLTGDIKSIPQTKPESEPPVQVDDEVIRIETDLVTIPVSVLDRNGRFVGGLRKQDFRIFEDGIEQKIELFAPVEQPFTVLLLLDVSNSTRFKIDEIQNSAMTFVDQLRRDDRVIVAAFDEDIHILSEATNNRAVLRNAIQQVRFGEGTSLYEAVEFSFRKLSSFEGRKALVLFTDGVDTTSKLHTYQSTLHNAEEVDALIYPIRYDTYDYMQSQGSGNSPVISFPFPFPRRRGGIWAPRFPGGGGRNGSSAQEYRTGQIYLESLATRSGGRFFDARDRTNLDVAFAGIAEELRRQYSLGYYPESGGAKGQRKQIKVEVNRYNAVVRARSSYIVGQAASNNAKSTRPAQPRFKTTRLPF